MLTAVKSHPLKFIHLALLRTTLLASTSTPYLLTASGVANTNVEVGIVTQL